MRRAVHLLDVRQRMTVAAVVLLTSLVACKKAPDSPAETPAVEVSASHPQVGPMSEEIIADAVLAPLAQAALVPRVSAPIRAEFVERGSHVRSGQLLVSLENRDLRGSAEDARGNLEQAQAAFANATQATIPEEMQKAQLDVDQARANFEVADRTARERQRLLAQGAIAGRDADVATAAAVQAQALLDEAQKHFLSVQQTTRNTGRQSVQGQLVSAQGRRDSAIAQVNYANLQSPIDGIVTDRPFFPGETAPAGSAVITVMDTSSLIAKIHMSQSSAQKLSLGGHAAVNVPGIKDPVDATVSLISPALDPGSTTVEVWLKLRNREGKLKVGTPVHAVIAGETLANVLQVPVAAVLPSPDGATYVLLVGSDSSVHKRTVKVGLRTAAAAQISDGLSGADLVVTEGGYGLDDGTKVTVNGAKSQGQGKD